MILHVGSGGMVKDGEPINAYVTRLKSQANKCNFADQAVVENNVIDQVIKGVAHSYVRKQLLDHDPRTLTLDRAEQYCRTYECTQGQLRQLGHSPVQSTIDNIATSHGLEHQSPKYFSVGPVNFCVGAPHQRLAIAQPVGKKVVGVTKKDIGSTHVLPIVLAVNHMGATTQRPTSPNIPASSQRLTRTRANSNDVQTYITSRRMTHY